MGNFIFFNISSSSSLTLLQNKKQDKTNDCTDTSILSFLSQSIDIKPEPPSSEPDEDDDEDYGNLEAKKRIQLTTEIIKPEPQPMHLQEAHTTTTATPPSDDEIGEILPEPKPPIVSLTRKRPLEATQTTRKSRTPTIISQPTVDQPKAINDGPVPHRRRLARNSRMKDLAVEVLTNFRQRSAAGDRFSMFGNYLAEHLRALPEDEATALEARLSQTLFGFLGARSRRRSPTPPAPPSHCNSHET